MMDLKNHTERLYSSLKRGENMVCLCPTPHCRKILQANLQTYNHGKKK